MEIKEKERLMLVEKKDHICELTLEILDMAHDPESSLEIRKNVTTILSELSTIASYSDSKNRDFDELENAANLIFSQLDLDNFVIAKCMTEVFCNAVNSIRFDFTRKGFKLVLPRIKNLNLGVNINR